MRISVLAALALAVLVPAAARAQIGKVPPIVVATTGPTLTLDEAISIARQNNPVYLAQTNARRTADASVRSARGAMLPSADAYFGSRYQEAGQQFVNGVPLPASGNSLQGSYGASVNYRVNAGTFVNPRAAVANRDAVEADISGQSEALRAAVTQQYLTVLQAQARSALQDTLVNTAKVQLDLARAKVAVGSGTILDIRRAEVALGQAQVALLTERNSVEVERLRLFQQMGTPQPAGVVLTTDFAVAPPTFGLDSLLDVARQRNPAIVALRARERAADLNVKVAKAAYTPTLSVSTGIGYTSYHFTDPNYLVAARSSQLASAQAYCIAQDSIRTRVSLPASCLPASSYVLTPAQQDEVRATNGRFFGFTKSPFGLNAQLSIPIYDNSLREERVERANVDRDDATYNVRAKDLALTADVTQAYLTVATAAQKVALAEQNATKAKEEVAFAEERYRVGAATFLDVTTSRSTYEQALIDRVNAVYDYHKAFAALENAVGRPLR